MLERNKPPFRADHVGSFIRPDDLIEALRKYDAKELPEAEFRAIQQRAIRDIVKLQEDLGFRVCTDGEFNRRGWHRDFLLKIQNVALVPSKVATRFHTATGEQRHAMPTMAVQGKLGRPSEMFVGDFRYLKSIAHTTPKLTIPSPTILHFRGGRETIDATAYPDLEGFYQDLARVYREEIADLAAAGCTYLQIDDTNFAYLCDPELRAHARSIGEDPDELPRTYARLINDAISQKPASMTVCLHICRGNFAGAWVASGGYEPVAEVVFNEINVDGFFLEFDSDRAGGFEPLRFLPKDKVAVIGLVTTKSPVMESKDDLKRRMDEAAKFASLDRLCLSPQCGFAPGIGGNAMTHADQTAKLRLVAETARDIWGTT